MEEYSRASCTALILKCTLFFFHTYKCTSRACSHECPMENWLTEWAVSKERADIFPLETETGRLQTNRPHFSLWQEPAYLVFSQTLCCTRYCALYFKEILYYTSRLPQTALVNQPAVFCQWKEKDLVCIIPIGKGCGKAWGQCSWEVMVTIFTVKFFFIIFYFPSPEAIFCLIFKCLGQHYRAGLCTVHHCFFV